MTLLPTGCFCNVGGCQEALGQSAADVEYNYSIGRVCSEAGHDVVNGKHTGELPSYFLNSDQTVL